MLHEYRIDERLGRGGFGITYLATGEITDYRVVIKENFPEGVAMRRESDKAVVVIEPEKQQSFDWALNNFLNEARLLARLKHPNIVPITTAFYALGTAYYVMPHIGGQALYEAAPPPDKINGEWLQPILCKLLHALGYLHSKELLHRDIKPNNIIINEDGEPILIDFGTVRAIVGTHTQTKIGTPGYTPLEQWATGSVRGPWTDFYALGATCYRLLTGENPMDCYERVLSDPPSLRLAGRPELQGRFSHELLSSIDKAFALRPEDRWQSAAEWLDALQSPAKHDIPEPALIAQPVSPTIEKPAPEPEQIADVPSQKTAVSQPENNDLLREAAENGKIKQLRLLIKAGADVNTRGKTGDASCPLYCAARNGHKSCVSELINSGADVNMADNTGITPLYSAAENGHGDCLKLLINAKADVNQADDYGRTPLYKAVWNGHIDCVKLLIAAKADVNKASKEGLTPLKIAKQREFSKISKLLKTAGARDGKPIDNPLDWLLS